MRWRICLDPSKYLAYHYWNKKIKKVEFSIIKLADEEILPSDKKILEEVLENNKKILYYNKKESIDTNNIVQKTKQIFLNN